MPALPSRQPGRRAVLRALRQPARRGPARAAARELLPEKRFCGSCGAPAGTPPTERFASPEGYTPRHLAEKILTSRAALEGERKQVTVLFADLKSSMELLSDRDPEEARLILDPVLERMMEAVHRFEGTVNQVLGDGIMALFGAPVAHEDHAVRACYAALRMQDAVRELRRGGPRLHGVPLHVRVGLNSGEVVVRSIGNDLHMDYTAVGQTTHLAARMEQLAAPGVRPGDRVHVARLAEGYVALRSLGPVPVKGLPEPIEIFAHHRRRRRAHAAPGRCRRAGSRASWAAAPRWRTWRRPSAPGARRPRPGRGAWSARPASGKSRLFWEFVHSLPHARLARARDGRRLLREDDVVPAGHRAAAGLLPHRRPRRPARDSREDRRQAPHAGPRAASPRVPAFLALLDVPVDDPRGTRSSPQQRRAAHARGAQGALPAREPGAAAAAPRSRTCTGPTRRPRRCSTRSSRACPTARILLLSTTGTSTSTAGASRSYYTQLRLDPLPPETRRVAARGAARRPTRASAASSACSSSARRATRSSSRRACARSPRAGCSTGKPRRLPPDAAAARDPASRARCRPCSPRASTGCRRREAPAPVRRR